MNLAVEFSHEDSKALKRLDRATAARVVGRVEALRVSPSDPAIGKLLVDGKGARSARVGDWRILPCPIFKVAARSDRRATARQGLPPDLTLARIGLCPAPVPSSRRSLNGAKGSSVTGNSKSPPPHRRPLLHDHAVGDASDEQPLGRLGGRVANGGEGRDHAIEQREGQRGADAAEEGPAGRMLPGGDHTGFIRLEFATSSKPIRLLDLRSRRLVGDPPSKVEGYTVLFSQLDDGQWHVIVPAFPEIVTWGRDLDEAREMARDALRLVVSGVRDRGEDLPSEVGAEPVIERVAV